MRGGGIIGLAWLLAACDSFGTTETADAGTPSSDGATNPDAGPFCARQPSTLFLCDDFGAPPSLATWTELAQDHGGVIEGANGVFIARGGSTVNGQAWAYLRKELGALTNEIIYSFTMRNLAPGTDDVELGGVHIDDGTGIAYSCVLHATPDGTLSAWEVGEKSLGVKDSLQKQGFAESPPANGRTRFVIHWTISDPPTLRIHLDDAVIPVIDMKLTPTRTTGPRHVVVGASYFTKPGVAFEFDDVTVERR